jgi:hypothetical protein
MLCAFEGQRFGPNTEAAATLFAIYDAVFAAVSVVVLFGCGVIRR